ncbi:MAG: hypothetical protein ABL986_15540 [Vicinamibacterales bacterium]
MDLPLRFVQAFLTLSVGVTIARLTTDTGGGDYFFTLIFLVVMGAAAPYWLAMKVARRTPPRWAASIAWAALAFGAIDCAVRVQAFYFPTEASGGGMALWLPIYAIGLIPLFALIAWVVVGVNRQ